MKKLLVITVLLLSFSNVFACGGEEAVNLAKKALLADEDIREIKNFDYDTPMGLISTPQVIVVVRSDDGYGERRQAVAVLEMNSKKGCTLIDATAVSFIQ